MIDIILWALGYFRERWVGVNTCSSFKWGVSVCASFMPAKTSRSAATLRQSGHLFESVDDIIDIVNGVNWERAGWGACERGEERERRTSLSVFGVFPPKKKKKKIVTVRIFHSRRAQVGSISRVCFFWWGPFFLGCGTFGSRVMCRPKPRRCVAVQGPKWDRASGRPRSLT